MNNTIADLPADIQMTSILALQIDGYGINGASHALRYIPDNHIVSRALSVMLSLGVSKWIRSMRPHGESPDPTTLSLTMRDGTEVCLERYVMDGGDGTLRSVKFIIQREMIEKAKQLYDLGQSGKLFIVEPD